MLTAFVFISSLFTLRPSRVFPQTISPEVFLSSLLHMEGLNVFNALESNSRYSSKRSFTDISFSFDFCDKRPAGLFIITVFSSSYTIYDLKASILFLSALGFPSISFIFIAFFPDNFSKLSSENQSLILAPDSSLSLPSAFLSFKVIFFFLSILKINPVFAFTNIFSKTLSSLCPLSFFPTIISIIILKGF